MSKPIDKSTIKRILVRSTNWVGDVVMTLPAFEAIRENFPDATITALARPWVIPLLENHPAVDDVIPFAKGNGFMADTSEVFRVVGDVRRRGFDLAILFQNAFEAALITCLGRIKKRVGYNTDGRGMLLSHPIKRPGHVLKGHQVEYYLNILKAMGWVAGSRDPQLFVAEKDRETVESKLMFEGIGRDDFLLGLSPGAVYGPAKRWPPAGFAAIGDRARETWGARILIFGSEKEKDVCLTVSQKMKHPPLNLCGVTTLGEAIGFMKACDLFVTNDSGLMHIAAAMNIPTVAIFGSTNPRATGPRSKNASIVTHEADCAPCLKPECRGDFHCMLGIEPQEIWTAMEALMKKVKEKST